MVLMCAPYSHTHSSFTSAATTPTAMTIMEPRRNVKSCFSRNSNSLMSRRRRSSSSFRSCLVASFSSIKVACERANTSACGFRHPGLGQFFHKGVSVKCESRHTCIRPLVSSTLPPAGQSKRAGRPGSHIIVATLYEVQWCLFVQLVY